jgi:sodium-dependent dicarboxylate transporter 2/3/5
MTVAGPTTAAGIARASASQPGWLASNWGLLAAIAVPVAIMLLPTAAGLPVAGHRMLAILGFAVVVWRGDW